MDFTIVGEVTDVEIIAKGPSIRRLKIPTKRYGSKNWRKMKGIDDDHHTERFNTMG
jgi:hypothetical protein